MENFAIIKKQWWKKRTNEKKTKKSENFRYLNELKFECNLQ